MNKNKESRLRRLVELYGVYKAYSKVALTCDLQGFDDMYFARRDEFMSELERYSRDFYHSCDARSMSRSLDDVVIANNQLALF